MHFLRRLRSPVFVEVRLGAWEPEILARKKTTHVYLLGVRLITYEGFAA